MTLRILLLEDRAADAELIEHQLRRGGIEPTITLVETEAAFRDALVGDLPQIILSDYHLPAFDGLSALALAQELAPHVPFVFVSGNIGEERAVEALRNGATDYVLKDRLTRLPSAVTRALREREEQERRRSAELALAAAEERFRYAMIATHDLIWEWDVRAGTVWTNRVHAHESLGPSTAGTFDDLIALVHPDDRPEVSRSVRDALTSDATTATIEYRVAAPGATWRRVVDRQMILRDDAGEAIRVIGAVMDVTEQRQLARQLEQSRRISDLGRLAATMAHEFNNVLMGMQPFVEILERKSADPAVQQIAGQLGRSTQRGKAITREILRFVNDSDLELAPIVVTAWLEGLAPELSALLGSATLHLDVPGETLRVVGDEAALQQVMTNLVINARDALPRGGTVTIRARPFDSSEPLPFVVGFATGEALHLTVADSGTGMSAETLDRIYEPLFTTKSRGNGLGLPYAHRTVTRHGGKIFVESSLGRGTTFHIFIPLMKAAIVEVSPAAIRAAASVRILVVEDDPEVAGATAAALGISGFTVDLVGRGAAVEEAIQRFAPHIVLLDICLPDENGFSVYARVRARWPDLPVVFASGHLVDASAAGSVGSNTAFVTKPYRISELAAIVGRLLNNVESVR